MSLMVCGTRLSGNRVSGGTKFEVQLERLTVSMLRPTGSLAMGSWGALLTELVEAWPATTGLEGSCSPCSSCKEKRDVSGETLGREQKSSPRRQSPPSFSCHPKPQRFQLNRLHENLQIPTSREDCEFDLKLVLSGR